MWTITCLCIANGQNSIPLDIVQTVKHSTWTINYKAEAENISKIISIALNVSGQVKNI